jgi:hypothetical protein
VLAESRELAGFLDPQLLDPALFDGRGIRHWVANPDGTYAEVIRSWRQARAAAKDERGRPPRPPDHCCLASDGHVP